MKEIMERMQLSKNLYCAFEDYINKCLLLIGIKISDAIIEDTVKMNIVTLDRLIHGVASGKIDKQALEKERKKLEKRTRDMLFVNKSEIKLNTNQRILLENWEAEISKMMAINYLLSHFFV